MSTIKLCAVALVCLGALVIDQPTLNTLVLGFIALMSLGRAYFDYKSSQTLTAQSKKLELVARVADNTHTLVNSQMGTQLELQAATAQLLADTTGKPEHVQLAKDAKQKLAEHRNKQTIMDRTPSGPASEISP